MANNRKIVSLPAEVREYLSRAGKKAAAMLTPEQRKERARKAGIAGVEARRKKAALKQQEGE